MLRVIAVATWLGFMGTGCVQIDGGAVELSWSIRNFDGEAASCDLRTADGSTDFADIADIRICWEPVAEDGEFSGACDPTLNTRFDCRSAHGVTGFEIAPGDTALWIEPLCEVMGPRPGPGPTPTVGKYEVPAPIVREVTSGEVVTLNALLIVAAPEACEPPANVVD